MPMMRGVRKWALAMALVLALGSLAGCAGTPAEPGASGTTGAASQAEPVELNLVAFPGVSAEALGDVNYEFNRLHPNVRVRIKDSQGLQLIGPDGPNATALDGIDIVLLPNNLLSAAAERGAVRDLSAVKVPQLSDLVAGMYDDLGQVEGKRYGLAVTASAATLLINEQQWTQSGLQLPAPDWTWQEFEQALAAFKAAGINTLVPLQSILDVAVRSYGGLMYDPDTAAWAFDTPEAKQGLSMLESLVSQELVSQQGPGAITFRAGPAGGGGGGGRNAPAIVAPGGPGGGVFIQSAGLIPQPFPRGPRGQYAPVTATLAAVTANSTNPELAIEYVKFLLTPEAQFFIGRSGSRPVIADARAQSAWQEKVGSARATAAETALRGGYVSMAPSFNEVLTGLEPYFSGQAALDATVDSLIAQLNQ